MNSMIQLVYHDLSFNFNDGNLLFNKDSVKLFKNNYNSLSIIGCQSSGKSTLLNKLFKTEFQEMNSESGNSQTTQGIWLSINPELKTIVFDCEGTDSKERGENRLQFENCSSLFCLALSDVLIMNMWTQDVGRYTASNYNVLKMVFEMNLKLFQQSCAKKIVVVLRDYNSKVFKREKFEENITKDIHKIWDEIKNPDNFISSKVSDFFQIEFVTLPHKLFQPEEFDSEVALLRDRFTHNNKNYLFDHSIGNKNVPIDGFLKYCENVWDTIIHEKDLNIPSQKEMLAIFRCNEIKEQTYNEIKEDLNILKQTSKEKTISDFPGEVEKIYNKAIFKYVETAKNYVDRIFLEVKQNLHNQLVNELFISFTNQINRSLSTSIKFFSSDLNKELSKGSNFLHVVIKVKTEHLEKLKSVILKIRKFEEWVVSIEEYEEQYDNVIENAKKVCLEKITRQTVESMKLQIKENLTEKLDGEINPQFWHQLNSDYAKLVFNKLSAFRQTLLDYYRMEESQIIETIQNLEKEIHEIIIKELNKRVKEISSFAIDYFKRIFLYNNRLPRNWQRMQEIEIDELYKKSYSCTEIIFDVFSSIKIVKSLVYKVTKYNFSLSEEEFNQILENTLKFIVEKEELDQKIDKTELSSLRLRFESNVLSIYEDAKRKHESNGGGFGGMPWWGWLIIAYTGYDDIFRLATSYLFIPVLLIIGAIVMAQSSTYFKPINTLIYLIQDLVIGLFRKKLK